MGALRQRPASGRGLRHRDDAEGADDQRHADRFAGPGRSPSCIQAASHPDDRDRERADPGAAGREQRRT